MGVGRNFGQNILVEDGVQRNIGLNILVRVEGNIVQNIYKGVEGNIGKKRVIIIHMMVTMRVAMGRNNEKSISL